MTEDKEDKEWGKHFSILINELGKYFRQETERLSTVIIEGYNGKPEVKIKLLKRIIRFKNNEINYLEKKVQKLKKNLKEEK